MTKFPWKLKYMAKYILKAFFLTTLPSTQKKCPKIYAVTLVLPLKDALHIHFQPKVRFSEDRGESAALGRCMPWADRLFSKSMKGKILHFLHEVEKMI